MSIDKLIKGLERLDYSERVAALVAHCRALGEQDAVQLCRELLSGDVTRRRLGLHLARLRGEQEVLTRALDDRSLSVRTLAAKWIGRHSTPIDPSLLDRLDAVSFGVLREQVLRHVRRDVAEVLVTALLARERIGDAAPLLAICSDDAVNRWLDVVAWPDSILPRLAKYRSALLVPRLEREFASERGDVVWQRHSVSMWAALAKREPATVARWVDAYADADSLPSGVVIGFRHLARWSPTWAVQALTARGAWVAQRGLPAGVARRVRNVDDEILARLGRALVHAAPLLLAELLSNLPYARRTALFTAATEQVELERVEWPPALLAVLPHALREREAARMLSLVRAQTDGSWRRQLLGFRDIATARAALELEGRGAQATERAEAHAALARSSARSRSGMTATLTWLGGRLKNEQDPVRLAVLSALAEVPSRSFDDAVALDAVLAPIFEARDTSYGTRAQAAKIAHQLMIGRATEPGSALFVLGLSVLERLAGQAGTPDLPRLDRNLPRGAERPIVDALLPWVEAAQKRRQEHHVYRLWAALGKRAWRVPALARILEQMLWNGQRNNVAWTARLLLEDPATRDERVRAMVARDTSALYVPAVLEHCHRRRQSLLIERFSTKAPKGRFHDGKVVVVPAFSTGFQRWTTELQHRYVALLRAAEEEPKRFSQTRAQLIALRAGVPVTRLADLASVLESSDVTTQEAALGALTRLDDAAPALPVLLQHMDSDRARVAMYAMPRLARLVTRDRMVDALAELLARPQLKVTVHKEVLRTLGQLGTPAACALVRSSWSKPLHRDVRIAAMHAARSLLHQAEAWNILEQASRDPDADVSRALVEVVAANVAQSHRERYLVTMMPLAEHPSPVVRAALFSALEGGWALVAPSRALQLSARVLDRLDPTDPWPRAAKLLAWGTRSAADHELIERTLLSLADAADRDVAPAGDADRLAHRQLVALVTEIAALRHPVTYSFCERSAPSLLARTEWWSQGVRLLLAAAPNARLGASVVQALASAPTAASCRVVVEVARAEAIRGQRDWQLDEALNVLGELRSSSVAASANGQTDSVAVALLAVFGPRWGWGSQWLAALAALRQHDDVDVRLAARELWLA